MWRSYYWRRWGWEKTGHYVGFLINCLKEAMEVKYLVFIELKIIYNLSCLSLN